MDEIKGEADIRIVEPADVFSLARSEVEGLERRVETLNRIIEAV